MTKGQEMYHLAQKLFPYNRSITGDGVRKTLNDIKSILPNMKIIEVESGTRAFDWTIPSEWNVKSAKLYDPNKKTVADFEVNNLHLVGYSIPVDKEVELEELEEHLFSLPNQPDAIPYVTSYYNSFWGFCLADNVRKNLIKGKYQVKIDSSLKPGFMTYGELIIPGDLEDEIFLSTYVCHPSMANNELSGPVVTTQLARWLMEKKRKYTYRIIFIPETIGSILYLSRNYETMKKNVKAGFNISCVGDDRTYSYLPTRKGDELIDKCIKHSLGHIYPKYIEYSWLDRGSDERQYNAPLVDLPVASIMRSKYGTYPEYHTSLDNLDLISPSGLNGSFQALKKCIKILENNEVYQVNVLGEPQLGKRGLYSNLSFKGSAFSSKVLTDFISYCDGSRDLLSIADIIGQPAWELIDIASLLKSNNLIKRV